jgi:predicted phosphodiesterase
MKSSIFLALFFVCFEAFSSTYAVIGDAGHWTDDARRVRSSLLKSKATTLILPGDNLYDTRLEYQQVWSHWTKLGFTFPVVALGNHNRSYVEEMEYFKMPAEFFATVIDETRFIVLNSDNTLTVREQASFLRTQLAAAKEKFVFLVYHHPPVTIRHNWREKEAFHVLTRPIILEFEKKITAILVGHDHLASLVEMNGIPVVVSGAVFESFLTPARNYTDQGLTVSTKWVSRGGFYWTRMDVDHAREEVWINFVRSDVEEVSCSARISPRPFLLRNNCSRKKGVH